MFTSQESVPLAFFEHQPSREYAEQRAAKHWALAARRKGLSGIEPPRVTWTGRETVDDEVRVIVEVAGRVDRHDRPDGTRFMVHEKVHFPSLDT